MKISLSIMSFIFISIVLTGCEGGRTAHYRYLPEGSSHEKNNWEYYCELAQYTYGLTDDSQRTCSLNKKDVDIFVIRKKDQRLLLKDQFKIKSGHLKPNFLMSEDCHNLKIEVIEEGNPFAKDDYNRTLIENGPRIVQTRYYKFDVAQDTYVLEKIEVSKTGTPEHAG